MVSTPLALIDPAKASSPGPISIGIDSPVIAEVSTEDRPVRTTPSLGMRSPARTNIRSPTRSSAGLTVCCSAPRRTVISVGTNASRARSPRRVRLRE